MGDKTYTVCEGTFYDSGGPLSAYGAFENNTITFYPKQPTNKLRAVFNSLNIESGSSDCNADALLVYDGPSSSGSPLATLCGSIIPGTINATNSQGALTFKFISNGLNNSSGWDITLSCFAKVGVKKKIPDQLRIFPNPVTERNITIESEHILQKLSVCDITGRTVYSLVPMSKQAIIPCNWPSGIYLLKLLVQDNWISKRVQVINH
jgi:hypothetical protein